MDLTQENKMLREKLDNAQRIIRGLQTVDIVARIIQVLCLTLQQARVIAVLLRREQVSKIGMSIEIYGRDTGEYRIFDVNICRIRKIIKPHRIHIITIYGYGWKIIPSDKDKLNELLNV